MQRVSELSGRVTAYSGPFERSLRERTLFDALVETVYSDPQGALRDE